METIAEARVVAGGLAGIACKTGKVPGKIGADALLLERIGMRAVGRAGESAVFRSRELSSLDGVGLAALEDRGIKEVYDMRKPKERARRPDVLPRGTRLISFEEDLQNDPARAQRPIRPRMESLAGKPGDRMIEMYRRMAHHLPYFRDLAQSVVLREAPVLVHCANGKDRTGVFSALLLLAAGMPYADVMDDYLRTNGVNALKNARDIAELSSTLDDRELAVVRSLFEAREEYLAAFFDEALTTTGCGGIGELVSGPLALDGEMQYLVKRKTGIWNGR